jgi:2-keto-4-pentenoate hydratase/2-oxohepta-3-ene-1,7-dioic acid hydratase in catechol pathway
MVRVNCTWSCCPSPSTAPRRVSSVPVRIACFLPHPDSAPHHGALLDDDELLDFDAPGADLPGREGPFTWLDMAGAPYAAAARLVAEVSTDPGRREDLRRTRAVLPRAQVQLLSPVPRPGKVICIGLNYRDHAEESGMDIPDRPLVFSKFPTSVVGPGAEVALPPGATECDYEAELGVVIGRTATGVSEADALEHVLGYVNVNDVSARDFQFADGQWQRGKSPDTFCPIGEFVATRDEIPDPHELRIQLHLNGKTLQDSNTDQLIFGVPALISALSEFTTLEPGDIVATGTPPGVGFARKPPIYLADGDEMVVEIQGLGTLRNPVVRR